MTCRQVVQVLTEYLDGSLPAAEQARVEEHLAGCDACTAFLAQLRTTERVVAGLAPVEVPADLKADLLRAFKDYRRISNL
jgi:anti-sigma factor RsiW